MWDRIFLIAITIFLFGMLILLTAAFIPTEALRVVLLLEAMPSFIGGAVAAISALVLIWKTWTSEPER